MSRRVVVLLVVLGITVPCALGAALWLSRGTGRRTGTFVYLTQVSIPAPAWRHMVVCMPDLQCRSAHHKPVRHKGGPSIRFSVTGAGNLGKFAYIKGWPGDAGGSTSRRTVLASFPSVPFHATRHIAAPRAHDRYTIWAQLWRGHVTCTLRIGHVSATGHVTGDRGAPKACRASLRWSARRGRWVRS
jgi:hypothetical protein